MKGTPPWSKPTPQTTSPAAPTHSRIPRGPACHQGALTPQVHGMAPWVQATILAQLDLVAEPQRASCLLSQTHALQSFLIG